MLFVMCSCLLDNCALLDLQLNAGLKRWDQITCIAISVTVAFRISSVFVAFVSHTSASV